MAIKTSRNRGSALFEKLGIFASFLLFTVFSVYMYSPVILSHAVEEEKLNVKVRAKQVISLSFDKPNLTLEGNPNNFVTGTVTAEVSSNSKYGYTLTFSDRDDDTELKNDASSATIGPFTSDFENTKTGDAMDENTWGYSINGTDFSAIPTIDSAIVLKSTNSNMTTESEHTTVTFGAKIGYVYSGTYSDRILYTAYVNGQDDPIPTRPDDPTPAKCAGAKSFYHINTLQEMNSCTCYATTTPLPTATEHVWEETDDNTKIPRTFLIDIRDGKSYIVQKLANGQCWMAQNLELELSTSKTLTNQDTDLNISASWTPDTNTSDDINVFAEYKCDKNKNPDCKGNYDNYIYWNIWEPEAHSYRPEASKKYYRNGVTPSSTPSTNDGKSNWESTGYFYDISAASADSNVYVTNAIGPAEIGSYTGKTPLDSICPKNWRLPKYYYDSYSGEYGYTEGDNSYSYDEYAYEHPDEFEDYVFDPTKIADDSLNLKFGYRKVDNVDYFNTLGFVAAGRIKASVIYEEDYPSHDDYYDLIVENAEFADESEYGMYNVSDYDEYEYGDSTNMRVSSNNIEISNMISRYWDGRTIRCIAR